MQTKIVMNSYAMAAYWVGIVLAPCVLLVAGALEAWGWEKIPKGFGIGWLIFISLICCILATVFMNASKGRKLLLLTIAVIAVPLGVLLSGLVLVWTGGVKGIQ